MGSYIKVLEDKGFSNVMGYEGDPPEHSHSEKMTRQDLTVPFKVAEPGNVICLEVAEHIPPKYEDAFLNNVIAACSNKFVTSWSMYPGDDGHVNCQDNAAAIERPCRKGLTYLPDETLSARASAKGHRLWYFETTTLIFRR